MSRCFGLALTATTTASTRAMPSASPSSQGAEMQVPGCTCTTLAGSAFCSRQLALCTRRKPGRWLHQHSKGSARLSTGPSCLPSSRADQLSLPRIARPARLLSPRDSTCKRCTSTAGTNLGMAASHLAVSGPTVRSRCATLSEQLDALGTSSRSSSSSSSAPTGPVPFARLDPATPPGVQDWCLHSSFSLSERCVPLRFLNARPVSIGQIWRCSLRCTVVRSRPGSWPPGCHSALQSAPLSDTPSMYTFL